MMRDDEEHCKPFVLAITDVLDLHSFQPRDVIAVVEEYLQEAHERGLRCIRIIHGRGIGVQREAVQQILAHTPFVLEYRDAPLEAGGWGATTATLAAPDLNKDEIAAPNKSGDNLSD